MKKQLIFITLLLTLISSFSFGQKLENQKYSDAFIENCIREVFQDQADVLVFNSNSVRYSLMSNFMKNNISVDYKPEYQGKKIALISSLGLNNKYNSSFQVDSHYDSSIFNPLKYKFPMSPRKKTMYRLDNTDYIISIFPSK